MTRDPRDPYYDPSRYCDRCLVLLPEDWTVEHDSDEWPECPICKRNIDRFLTRDEVDTEHAIRAADASRE